MRQTLTFTLLAALAGTVFAAGSAPSQITLPGTVRDFVPGTLDPGHSNPDFESGIGGLVTGLVQPTLTGSAPTPSGVYGAPGYISSAASFAEWYGAAAPSKAHALTLTETAPGSGVYAYASNGFFPIDGELLGNQGRSHNYHFTYQIAATFGYQPGTGQSFTFTGDDDVWVFFDKQLGIDLGGVHGATTQTVKLDDLFGPGKAAGNYAFDFFFAERHTTESNLRIETSLQLEPVQAEVPEPASFALAALGLAGIGAAARRRKAG